MSRICKEGIYIYLFINAFLNLSVYGYFSRLKDHKFESKNIAKKLPGFRETKSPWIIWKNSLHRSPWIIWKNSHMSETNISSEKNKIKEKIIVAVDLDEVLGLFVESLSNFHNDLYGTNLNVSHFHSYEFHRIWGGTQDEASVKVNEFFESK